ncbi:MAG TPA: J domain-containing protein [Mycobacterium sp.]|jgi:DnaJ-class molecular chaperone
MTTKHDDLYAILGVAPQATQAEIARAYRALLRRHHPDTRAVVEESHGALCDTALRQVLGAYAVLRDPTRRVGYDRTTSQRAHPARRQLEHQSRTGMDRQPLIVAGPVYWQPPC